jgi:1-acyl-sn-glycerol-3-phosphate acyltransferase
MAQSLIPPDPLGRVSVAPWLYWGLFPIHRVFLRSYFQISIQGVEQLPASGPVIFAPKHYSRWDPVLLGLLSREPLWFMTNANEFGGFQGWLVRRLGAFPMDVDHPKASSYRYAINLLQAGKKMVVFPEGGIVRDHVLRPLKPGLARLVLQAEKTAPEPISIPIVPIALFYKPDAIWQAKIVIHVGTPLHASDFQQGNDRQTAHALTQALQAALLNGLEKSMRCGFVR